LISSDGHVPSRAIACSTASVTCAAVSVVSPEAAGVAVAYVVVLPVLSSEVFAHPVKMEAIIAIQQSIATKLFFILSSSLIFSRNPEEPGVSATARIPQFFHVINVFPLN
jgi:hypothetical protein